MRRIVLVTAASALLVLGLASFAFPQYPSYGTQSPGADLKKEIATAIEHAGNSARSEAKPGAVNHLWHALNCIEGERGKNFNRAPGNVCQGMGNGILTDLKNATGGQAYLLVANAADGLALAGVGAGSIAEVRNAARGVGALLQTIADGMK